MKKFLVFSLFPFAILMTSCASDGLTAGDYFSAIFEGVAGGLSESARDLENRYGDSAYYRGSKLERIGNTTAAVSGLMYDAMYFCECLTETLETNYGIELLAINIETWKFRNYVYDSLKGKNEDLKFYIMNNKQAELESRIDDLKNQHGAITVKAKYLANEVNHIIEDLKRGTI